MAQEGSEESNNVVGGGVKSSLNGSTEPVQKHPQPEGQIGTDNSNDLQHEMWVTCPQLKHVLARPADNYIVRSVDGPSNNELVVTFDRKPTNCTGRHGARGVTMWTDMCLLGNQYFAIYPWTDPMKS